MVTILRRGNNTTCIHLSSNFYYWNCNGWFKSKRPHVHPIPCQEHSADHGLQQDRQVRRLGNTDWRIRGQETWLRTYFHQPFSPSCTGDIHWIHVYWSRFLSILSLLGWKKSARIAKTRRSERSWMSADWKRKNTDSSWCFILFSQWVVWHHMYVCMYIYCRLLYSGQTASINFEVSKNLWKKARKRHYPKKATSSWSVRCWMIFWSVQQLVARKEGQKPLFVFRWIYVMCIYYGSSMCHFKQCLVLGAWTHRWGGKAEELEQSIGTQRRNCELVTLLGFDFCRSSIG